MFDFDHGVVFGNSGHFEIFDCSQDVVIEKVVCDNGPVKMIFGDDTCGRRNSLRGPEFIAAIVMS